MNYANLEFWQVLSYGLFFIILVKCFSKPRGLLDRYFLLILSLGLFALESLTSFSIFLGLCILTYGLSLAAQKYQWKNRWIVLASSLIILTPLVYFKYREFIIGGEGFATSIERLIIPIGISFYSFQLVSYLIDSRRNSEKISAVDFFNYASFFPQIVAGPIERRADLLPQLQNFSFRFSSEWVYDGARYVIIGLFYKLVIGDNLALSSGWVAGPVQSPWLIHLANFLFGLRIYFDFCGYSLIALGIARALGIQLTFNFLSPYSRRNIQEFWRNWHRSLSHWFRDYVYIPLGGNQSRFPILLVGLVFVISGIWHGAGWNFALWGAFHAIMVVGFMMIKKKVQMPAFLAHAITLFLVMFSWVFFYNTHTDILFIKLKQLISPAAYMESPVAEFLGFTAGYGGAVTLLVITGFACCLILLEFCGLKKRDSVYSLHESMPFLVFCCMTLPLLIPLKASPFVYFNF